MKTYRMTVDITMFAFDKQDAIDTLAYIQDDMDFPDIKSFILRDIEELTEEEI